MNAYRARRAGETPGVAFAAPTAPTAKAKASRLLERGAFNGQRIILVEDTDFPRVWHKQAGGRWIACD